MLSRNYKIIFVLIPFFSSLTITAQTLGNYPNASVTAGQNITISPSTAPTASNSVVAYTNANFTGVLSVNPTTGVVTVTNARQAGNYLITVKAFGAGTATKTFTLIVNNPSGSQGGFCGANDFSVGKYPSSAAIGDFNRDGKQDIAVSNHESSTVSIRLGDGLGGFSGTTDVETAYPVGVAIGDFNNDGKQDFAAATSGSVSVRMGDGLGGFTVTNNFLVGGANFSLAIGDFNGDSKQDIAIADFIGRVSIRLGDGLGNFSGTTEITVGGNIYSNPFSIVIGDFNGDGKQDFATANLSSNTISIRMGNGLGSFFELADVAVESYPECIAIGDFNGDLKQDFAVTCAGTISIRLGNGQGGFSGTTNVVVGGIPRSVAIGDFNGDGKQDLAVVNSSNQGDVSIWLGDGIGGFSFAKKMAVGAFPRHVAIGDFNSDGLQDFVTSNAGSNSISIRMGTDALTNTWLGITTDWNTPSNWSTGMVPSACTPVIVNANVPNMPTVSGINNTCFTLKLGNGATVNMAPGAVLNITGK